MQNVYYCTGNKANHAAQLAILDSANNGQTGLVLPLEKYVIRLIMAVIGSMVFAYQYMKQLGQ